MDAHNSPADTYETIKLEYPDGTYLFLNFKRNKHGEQQFLYVAPAPTIRKIVLSGGGARGVAYIGVLKALEEVVTLHGKNGTSTRPPPASDIDCYVGTSIGSTFATLAAAGIRYSELNELSKRLDFGKLLSEGDEYIYRSGLPFYHMMRDSLSIILMLRFYEIAGKPTVNPIQQTLETIKTHVVNGLNQNHVMQGLKAELRDYLLKSLNIYYQNYAENTITIDKLIAYHEEMKNCSLILSATEPNLETLSELTNASTAYVRHLHKLFYLDVANTVCIDLNISPKIMSKFDNELLPSTKARTLSNGERRQITAITNFALTDKIYSNRITFAMLHGLHLLYPKIFKQLKIASHCSTTKEIVYFDVESSPHLEIPLASRASAGVPIAVVNVAIEKRWLNCYDERPDLGDDLDFIDGGWQDNSPYNAIKLHPNPEYAIHIGDYHQDLETLIFLFDDSAGPKLGFEQTPFKNHRRFVDRELSQGSMLEDFFFNHVVNKIGRINSSFLYTEKRAEQLEYISRAFTQRNIALHTGIESHDFERARLERDRIINDAYNETKKYLMFFVDGHTHISTHDFNHFLIDIPQDAFKSLTELLQNKHLPAPIDFEKIKQKRMQKQFQMRSLFPNFDALFHIIMPVIKTSLKSSKEVLDLQQELLIIKADDSTTDDIKLLRVSLVAARYATIFNMILQDDTVLSICNTTIGPIITKTVCAHDAKTKTIFPITAEITNHLQRAHYFYDLYQIIQLQLSKTPSSLKIDYLIESSNEPSTSTTDTSSLVNSSSSASSQITTETKPLKKYYKRSYKSVIIYELQDIAAFHHLTPHQKLYKMEDFLYYAYHVAFYHRGKKGKNSALVLTLKDILQTKLKIFYYYGVTLSDTVTILPQSIVSLHEKYMNDKKTLRADFLSCLTTTNTPLPNALILAPYFSIQNRPKTVIIRAAIHALKQSTISEESSYAKKLATLVPPVDWQHDMDHHKELVTLVVLLIHSKRCKKMAAEQPIYENIVTHLLDLLIDHPESNKIIGERLKAIACFGLNLLRVQYHGKITPTLFKGVSDFVKLISDFVEQQLGITASNAEFFDSSTNLKSDYDLRKFSFN